MSGIVADPFSWDSSETFGDTTVFVVFTSGEKSKIKYHFKNAQLKRLCLKVGACKKKKGRAE